MRNLLIIFIINFFALSGIVNAQNKVPFEKLTKRQFSNSKNNFVLRDSISELLLQTSSNIELCDSIYYWSWDTITSNWLYSGKEIYLYNVDNKLIIFTIHGNANPYSRVLFDYDLNGNNILYTYETWNGSGWISSQKFTISFNSNNLLTNRLWQNWNGTSWVNMVNYSYSYDSNNNVIESITQVWNGSSWDNNARDVFTYDVNGNLISYLEQGWAGINWYDAWLRSYTYDGMNNNITIIRKLWDLWNWQNNDQEVKSYDNNNNMINRLVQSWYGNTWYNNVLYTGIFNINNQQIQNRVETWDGNSWMYNSQYLFTYTPYNSYSTIVFQNWKGNNWVNFDSLHYYYHLSTDIKSNQYLNEFEIYPNPTKEEIKLKFNSDRNIKIVVNVSNSLGQEIYEMEEELYGSKSEINLNTFELPEGVYYIKCRINESIINKKFIKIN